MAKQDKYSFNAEESGSNTTLLIGGLLVLIILVGGGLLYILGSKIIPTPLENQTQVPQNQTSNQGNNTTITPPVCDDNCYYQLGINNKNLSACLQMANETLRQSCFTILSNESLDACKLLTDQGKREGCIMSFALANKDISLCNQIKNGTACKKALDSCYGLVDQDFCRAMRDSNANECNSDTTCLLNYSVAKKNASSCALIQNDVAVQGCFSAVSGSDRCSDLVAISQKDYCYEIYGVYSNNYLICTEISDSNIYMTDCLSQLAARAHDPTVCKTDGMNLDNLWACYINYSLISGDISGCYLIDDLATTNKYKCASGFAQLYGDPSACNAINDNLAQRVTCYQGAITYYPQNLNWVNCANVTNFNWKNQCYVASAKKYNDVSICNNIDADFAKTSCIDSYNLYAANQTK